MTLSGFPRTESETSVGKATDKNRDFVTEDISEICFERENENKTPKNTQTCQPEQRREIPFLIDRAHRVGYNGSDSMRAYFPHPIVLSIYVYGIV